MEWFLRKHNEAVEQQYNDYRESVYVQYKGLLLFADRILNKGENFDALLPPTLEEMNQQQQNSSQPVQQENSKYVTGTWWEPKADA